MRTGAGHAGVRPLGWRGRFPLVIGALIAACGAIAACGGSAPASSPATHAPSPSASSPSASASASAAASPARPVAASVSVRLAVPAGLGGGAFATPRTLRVPPGWTAQVWALVPGARMEAWTPQGDLLVSEPGNGRVVALTPRPGKPPASRTLLSGLTMPQGLAFARVGGRWVLYVGESEQIDRYPWGTGGISGSRTVIAGRLPDLDPSGDDVHREKDVAVAPDGTVYFDVGSSSNASPGDRTATPPRGVIMAVSPEGKQLRVVEKGVRNGEGLAVAPDGSVWTAVNNRDNISYPFHSAYGGNGNAFGQVIQAYVNDHPPDEVVPVTPGRDLGWPYCNPDTGRSHPAGSLADVPFVPDAVTNPGGRNLDCAALPAVQVGIPAHSAPLGMSFLEGSAVPAPWSGGAVVAVHGSWNREPPRPPAVLWMAWNAAGHTLEPAVTLVGGFQNSDGSRWGRPADAVPGPDGALYVTDDTAGAVYRLAPPP
jgi:glucose/arabinose dehydrogenase